MFSIDKKNNQDHHEIMDSYYYGNTCHHKNITCIKILKYLLLCTIVLLLIGLTTLTIQCLILTLSTTTTTTNHSRDIISSSNHHHHPHQVWNQISTSTTTTVTNSVTTSQTTKNDKHLLELRYLLADYSIVLLVSLVALTATLKENFFFLVTTATINAILSFGNIFVPGFRLSIIFLQAVSALFTFGYTLSMYFQMKFDIRRRKRVKKLESIQRRFIENNMGSGVKTTIDDPRYHSPDSHPSDSHSYDKLMLTNEWLRMQQDELAFQNIHHTDSISPQQNDRRSSDSAEANIDDDGDDNDGRFVTLSSSSDNAGHIRV